MKDFDYALTKIKPTGEIAAEYGQNEPNNMNNLMNFLNIFLNNRQ